MAEAQNEKFLELKICNKTQNITLKYHGGQESPQLNPELLPDSSVSCDISKAPNALGVEKVLVYEAESFTLAIAFHIYELLDVPVSMVQLELSPDKSHLDDLERTLRRANRLLDAPDAERTAVARGMASGRTAGGVQLNAGPYQLSAIIEHRPASVLEIRLDVRRPLAPASDDGEPSPCKIL